MATAVALPPWRRVGIDGAKGRLQPPTADRVHAMEAPTLDRRLVAILAADVEGYSRLMALDEEAALATLSAHRAIADELIVAFRGRIANTAGDSVLAEFASVVDAVRCAWRIQSRIAEANGALPEARQMHFRIGLNVGDVMVKDGDIFGDGVNVAARLQALADADGICVARGVRDHVRHLAGFSFEDLGEQSVKNIARPVRAFRLTIDPQAVQDWADEAVPPPAGTGAGAPAVDSTALDLAMWETVSGSDDVSGLLRYLERFPAGEFAEIARERITARSQPTPAAAPAAPPAVDADTAVELTFWESVRASENPAMYEAYLEKYPDGEFVLLARVRLGELQSP
jgi:class 3 adenylate cyclase